MEFLNLVGVWCRWGRAWWWGVAVLWGLGGGAAQAADEFLPPEQALAFSATAVDGRTVHLHWAIAPGYHLYRDRISVQADAPGVRWEKLALPAGVEEFDSNFNKTVAVYRQTLDVDLHLTEGRASVPITVGWQGCADAGLCYPPDSAQLQVELTGLGAARNGIVRAGAAADPQAGAAAEPPAPASPVRKLAEEKRAPAQAQKAQEATDSIASALASGSLLRTMGVFLLAGLLLAFTPCVLPMVPILSSLIVGQTGTVSRSKGFVLSLAYALGMALVYAGFGVAAGLAGEGLAAALQNPWVLGGFALLLSTLALSMFGFYELQMPSAIQSRATQWSNGFQGGSLLGVFLMGGISALVVGPCVAAPLAGALIYISRTRDVVLGGLALFSMAMGMSVPLLLVGLSAGSLLPRAGVWMERVKQVFGMMLLGVAIWMVSPVLPAAVHMLVWAVWLLIGAALLGVFGAGTLQHVPVAARSAGVFLLALSGLLLVGAASGGQSVLQPLAHWKAAPAGAGSVATTAREGLRFERVATRRELDALLAQAHQSGQKVMLDFYADWCVACKEFETFTFSDPEVQKSLASVRLLQVDVTANNAEDKALLKRFDLFGPPGVVFFDGAAQGALIHKVVGYQAPTDFLASLGKARIR
ncbi:protein-disulfide reductase DsbD [Extensimonas sp. H3M7-6]|uniref:protein-disulfide reductase DsbD n=1 Tax=Extensimonas soli TaxID=3031322 RepID=UPI0023DC95D8|nr:protein-disulfide reductase DsbD [Extensimonas sp. H3M7-6]MDF1482228.1 protein-disulfide reductase DsbD [Extensimonas sp. H3M7-6]